MFQSCSNTKCIYFSILRFRATFSSEHKNKHLWAWTQQLALKIAQGLYTTVCVARMHRMNHSMDEACMDRNLAQHLILRKQKLFKATYKRLYCDKKIGRTHKSVPVQVIRWGFLVRLIDLKQKKNAGLQFMRIYQNMALLHTPYSS